MTVNWMLGSMAAGVLLALAALCAEPVAAWFRLPRRWTWAAAMAGALLLPLAAAVTPDLLPRIDLPAARTGAAPVAADPSAPSRVGAAVLPVPVPPAPAPLPAAAYAVWLAASLATAAALAWARRRVLRACAPWEARRVMGTRVLVSERAGPLVLGVLDPQIVLPRWVLSEPGTCRVVVRHEREHVAAGDPWLLAAAAFAVALVPWSPALWWMHRRLRLAVESDCDARVLDAGESRRAYLNALLDTAGRREFRAALAWAGRRSQLERRLLALTQPRPRWRVARALPLLAVTCIVAAAACRIASDSAVREVPATLTQAVPAMAFTAPLDTAIVIDEHDGSLTASFQVPGNDATPRRWTLVQKARLEPLGFELREPGREAGAAAAYPVVRTVSPGSAAERAGVRVDDVVLAVNGHDPRRPFATYRSPRQAYSLRVRRAGGAGAATLVIPPAVPRGQAEAEFRAWAACFRDARRATPPYRRDPGRCLMPRVMRG